MKKSCPEIEIENIPPFSGISGMTEQAYSDAIIYILTSNIVYAIHDGLRKENKKVFVEFLNSGGAKAKEE